MAMELLFAGVPVGTFRDAAEWYGRLFGRDPDVVVHDREVMWRVAGTGWLYVLEDPPRAGQTLVTIAVSDLDATVTELSARGIDTGPVEKVGDAGRRATATDPEGNSIALIQVATGQ